MKYFTLILILLSMAACGKSIKLTIVALIPAHSTADKPYTGPCASTYNANFTEYEVVWSDGSSACWPRDAVEGKIKVGDSEDMRIPE